MAQKATHDDWAVFSLEGGDYLGDTIQLTLEQGADLTDPTGIGDINDDSCPQKLFCNFRASILDDVSGGCRVGAIDVSALTLGGVNIYAEVESANISIVNAFRRAEGVGDKWRGFSFTKQRASGTITMMVPTDFASLDQPLLDCFSSTIPDRDMVLAFTVNGAAWSIPFVIERAAHSVVRDDLQKIVFTLAPGGAPTLPSGTGSLILKAMNAPSVSQTLVLSSKAAGGIAYGGEFLPESVGFSFTRGELIVTDYSYISEGTITAAATV